jgi:starch synthase
MANICQIAAEVAPFAKTGGLGDVTLGLSRFLGQAGHDVRVFLPYYPSLREENARSGRYVPVGFIQDIPIQLGSTHLSYSLRTAKLPDSEVDAYFVDCPALFGEGGIYRGDRLDSRRFGLLTIAAFECCQRMGWAPDIVHVHDWHTALAPLLLRTHFSWDRLFARTSTVLTIHNAGYQGIVGTDLLGDLGLDRYAHLLHREDLANGHINFLKSGVLHAGVVTAVSKTYAKEIQRAEFGHGLEPWLRARGVVGIVNGVDYGDWNPETDRHLDHHYSAADLSGKRRMKKALLEEVGLGDTDAPVIGIVSRLTSQKGFDLGFEILPRLLAHHDVRIVALGSGEPRYEEFFLKLQQAFPHKAWFYRGFHNPLAHQIEGGADLFLMPSRFEPCGLNQMYSLRYGTPPIVHKTGGLADTVEPYDPESGRGTGFVFEHFTPAGLAWALDSALRAYADRDGWARLQANGMAKNTSWEVQGQEYIALYSALVGN